MQKRIFAVQFLSLLLVTACGSETPLTTNPISDGISGTRVATPKGSQFSNLDSKNTLASKSLVGTFLLSPDQLRAAARQEIEFTPKEVLPCVDCLAKLGIELPEPAKNFGSYLPDDFKLSVKVDIPEDKNPIGSVTLSLKFNLKTKTQLINPGKGAQLTIQEATLQDTVQNPQATSSALRLPDPIVFEAKDITQGQSTVKSLPLTFGEAPFKPRYLKLKVVLTSPVPTDAATGKVTAPPEGQVYIGSVLEDVPLSQEIINQYQDLAGKSAAWVRILQVGHQFPAAEVKAIQSAGSVPYLQLLLEEGLSENPTLSGSNIASDPSQNPGQELERQSAQDQSQDPSQDPEQSLDKKEPKGLKAILMGKEDQQWDAWAKSIKDLGSPVMIQIGQATEDPETLKAVYQYIIERTRKQDVTNSLWIYHLDPNSQPIGSDYPGDEWIDWLGFDLVVATDPNGARPRFRSRMDIEYPQVAAFHSRKPIILARFGLLDPNPDQDPLWLETALKEILEKRWPRLIGFAWDETAVPLQDAPELAEVMQKTIEPNEKVLGRVITTPKATLTSNPTSNPKENGITQKAPPQKNPLSDPQQPPSSMSQ
jgi:hypothetical protein